MSFLSNMYNKEGPGVYPDDPEKGAVGQFFSILGRKFWKIVTINIMYVLFSIPTLALTVFISPVLLQFLFPGLTAESVLAYIESTAIAGNIVEGISSLEFANMIIVFLYILTTLFFVSLSLFVLGPVLAGVTYILRNYAREEHAFIWSDFVEHAKKNAGQSLIACVIGFVAAFAMAVSLGFYRSLIENDFMRILITGFILSIFVVFTVMQMYIYPMMVTFKLSLKNIYKNAFLFFTLRLFPNLGILLISLALNFIFPALVIFLLPYPLGFYLVLLYYLVIGFGLQLFITNFYVYRQLDRFMIQRINEEANALADSKDPYADLNEEAVTKDDSGHKDPMN